jgi:DNA-binding NarL/FixJ family response regulator
VRVARAAARGVSNREIAQSMFVTMKTVETQLRSVYQKLAITGREQLSTALGRPSSID